MSSPASAAPALPAVGTAPSFVLPSPSLCVVPRGCAVQALLRFTIAPAAPPAPLQADGGSLPDQPQPRPCPCRLLLGRRFQVSGGGWVLAGWVAAGHTVRAMLDVSIRAFRCCPVLCIPSPANHELHLQPSCHCCCHSCCPALPAGLRRRLTRPPCILRRRPLCSTWAPCRCCAQARAAAAAAAAAASAAAVG